MKQEELVQFAADSFNKADSKCQGMGGATASAKNLYTQEFDNKEGSTVDDQISKMNQVLNENTTRGTQKPLLDNVSWKWLCVSCR